MSKNLNPYQAQQHIRLLEKAASDDCKAKYGKPARQLGNDAQRRNMDQIRASLWLSVQKAGGTIQDADAAVIGSFSSSSPIANRVAIDTPAPTATPRAESKQGE